MSPARPTIAATDWLLLLALSVLWGGSFFFAKIAVGAIPPLTVALGRVAIAAAGLVLVARMTGIALPTTAAAWLPFVPMGLLNNVLPFSLLFWAQTHITSGLAAILNATTPLFTVLVAHFATQDEKLNPGRVAGLTFGFAGVVAMIGPDALQTLGRDVLAQLACLAAALSYAFAGVYGRRFRGEPPLRVAAGQLTASSVLLLPIAMLVEQPWSLPPPPSTALGALVALAILSTALAYVIFFRILARAGATGISLVTFLIPASAILLGTLILGEQLATRHIVGMIAIAFGLAAIDGRPIAWVRSRVLFVGA
ncbi:MAG: DMT family transporter [Alphaproteobacteria bacterium]|nr:DMT family transporter [Alphaproteobacteria bacterium]